MADDGVKMNGDIVVRPYETEDNIYRFLVQARSCATVEQFLAADHRVDVAEWEGRLCGLIVTADELNNEGTMERYIAVLAADEDKRGEGTIGKWECGGKALEFTRVGVIDSYEIMAALVKKSTEGNLPLVTRMGTAAKREDVNELERHGFVPGAIEDGWLTMTREIGAERDTN